MADITVNSIYEQVGRTIKPAGTDRFARDFISAFNGAIDNINRRAVLSTRISHISDISGTVDLSDEYWDVLLDGVVAHIAKLGHRPSSEQNATFIEDANQRFLDGIESLQFDLINQRMADDPDDESDDIIGLGHLG